MLIHILDTTLRDGEQTSGVSFSPTEKQNLAKVFLQELKVDRIEIASARVSEGEKQGAKKILDWAIENNFDDLVEILGFVDKGKSVDWILSVRGKVLNLLTKGSLKHCEEQLRKTPIIHFKEIIADVEMAKKKGLTVNIYLEDWSNGMRHSPDYVYQMIDTLKVIGINRFMLPDTLGILSHEETYTFCKDLIDKYPQLDFDFHGHNDYDLATSNAYAAIQAGITCIHTTLNGLGERSGNVCLSSVIGIVKDHLNYDMNIVEKKLHHASKMVESFSGIRIPENKPIIGASVFTQTSGIHADGDSKNNLYQNNIRPERFGRKYEYALGKMSGQASIKKNLEELGIILSPEELKKVREKIIHLGDRKQSVTKEDLPYIISDILKQEFIEEKVKVLNYSLSVAEGLLSSATLHLKIGDEKYQSTAAGDGQYDAVVNALKLIYNKRGVELPKLIDYVVTIPPGGKTDALVKTRITWRGNNSKIFNTTGLDSDQTVAAIKATIKMLNIIK